jgi:hypothetical protein
MGAASFLAWRNGCYTVSRSRSARVLPRCRNNWSLEDWMEVKSIKETHTELMMQSVKFAKDEQGRRKGQAILFKWPEIEKQLGEHKHIYVVDARLGSNNHTHRLWYDVIPPHTEEGQEWKSLGHRHTVEAIIYFLKGQA